MAKKELITTIKLQLKAGQANPAPPVGPVLGQHGVNIMEFCKQFNAKTQKSMGEVTPVVISVYKDRSFTFETKIPPVSYLILQKIKKEKGSPQPNKDKIGTLTRQQVLEIARVKLPDLNCTKEASAYNIVAGTARSMGVNVVEQ